MSNTSRRNHIKQGRMLIVADLYKRGWSISKIAAEVRSRMNTSCSTRTIWRDIQSLLEEWRSTRIDDVDQRLQLELERIDDAIRELWEQWEKSKTNYIKTARKQKGTSSHLTYQAEQTEMEVIRLGDPSYIAEIRQQLAERRKLLGLYAATKTEVTGKNGAPLIPAEKMTEEEIQAEIDKIRSSMNC